MTYSLQLAPGIEPRMVGAKAANLGRLMGLGLAVPSGFVVTRASLTTFLQEAALTGRVRKYLATASSPGAASRRKAYERIVVAVMAAPLPGVVEREVSRLAGELLASSPSGLAVRSSSIIEDSDRACFAGVFESYLGIVTVSDLWERIRRCWCSSWSPAAIDYARKMGVAVEPDQMAVLVQTLVAADSSGVLFTADPMTDDPYRFVANSTTGLAQDLVAGRQTGDRFELAWDTSEIVDRLVGYRVMALVAGPLGLDRVALTEVQRGTASVSDETLARLGRIALGVDRAFGKRMDIEWAVQGGDVIIVQARPITALSCYFPLGPAGPDTVIPWSLTTLGFYRGTGDGSGLVAPLFQHEWRSELWLRHALPDLRGQPWPRRAWRERDIHGYRYATEAVWEGGETDWDETIRWLESNEAWWRADWARRIEWAKSCSWQAVAGDEGPGRARVLARRFQSFEEPLLDMEASSYQAAQFMGFTCEYLLKNLTSELGVDFRIERLFRGLPSYSYERAVAAQDLARSIHEPSARAAFADLPLDQVLPHLAKDRPSCEFLTQFRRFCRQFGLYPPEHPAEWLEWGDNSAEALALIRSVLQGQASDVRAVYAEAAGDRAAAERELGALAGSKGPGQAVRADNLVRWSHFWVPALDNRKWQGCAYMHALDLLMATGDALAKDGGIDRPHDILLVPWESLSRFAEGEDLSLLREAYERRRRECERDARLTPPMVIGTPNPEPVSEVRPAAPASPVSEEHPDRVVLKGKGLSPGRVTGVARRSHDVSEPAFLDALRSGDIVVTDGAQSNAIDWLSLLMIVKGLVTVQGAALHHAVQISRECGAAYVNLPDSEVAQIPDRAAIIVDGDAGTVTVGGVRVP